MQRSQAALVMNVTAAGQMANPPLPPPVAFVGLASGNNFRCCTTGEGVPERAVVYTMSSTRLRSLFYVQKETGRTMYSLGTFFSIHSHSDDGRLQSETNKKEWSAFCLQTGNTAPKPSTVSEMVASDRFLETDRTIDVVEAFHQPHDPFIIIQNDHGRRSPRQAGQCRCRWCSDNHPKQ